MLRAVHSDIIITFNKWKLQPEDRNTEGTTATPTYVLTLGTALLMRQRKSKSESEQDYPCLSPLPRDCPNSAPRDKSSCQTSLEKGD